MSEYLESKDIKQLMAEADELVKRIDADAIKNYGRGASPAGLNTYATPAKKISGSGQDQEERQAGWEKYFFPAPLTYRPSPWSR